MRAQDAEGERADRGQHSRRDRELERFAEVRVTRLLKQAAANDRVPIKKQVVEDVRAGEAEHRRAAENGGSQDARG